MIRILVISFINMMLLVRGFFVLDDFLQNFG